MIRLPPSPLVSLPGAISPLPWNAGLVPSGGHSDYMTAAAIQSSSSPSPMVRRRAPIACRRCRRMRSKCVHDQNNPYCRACKLAGVDPRDCVYPVRGQPDNDREYRHPRIRASKPKSSDRRRSATTKGGASKSPQNLSSNEELAVYWELPPTEELVEAVSRFCSHSFQLSFISKDEFCSRLRDEPESVSPFLLVCILAVSARVSPMAIERYKSGEKASLVYLERASAMSLEQTQEPTLERCQAFCLLSVAQHCHGFEKESYLNLGIAIRMASWLQLHKEETFHVDSPCPRSIRGAESARRTLWMLFCHENLFSGSRTVAFLSPPDVTTLLPCSEPDFTQGQEPRSRATLADTPPAIDHPGSTHDRGRSLFASMIQIYHIWGTVGRIISHPTQLSRQSDLGNDMEEMKQRLKQWEDGLPKHHVWSLPMLRKHRANGHELAYLRVTMMLRLCNITVRQSCVEEIINVDLAKSHDESYIQTCLEAYRDVCTLFIQIDNLFSGRFTSEGGEDHVFALCVYTCGLFSAYLCKFPSICQDLSIVEKGPRMLSKMLSILDERADIWPYAARWSDELTNIQPCSAGSNGEEVQFQANLRPSMPQTTTTSEAAANPAMTAPVGHFDRPAISDIGATHPPIAPISQASTAPIGEMAPSRHFASHVIPVTSQEHPRHSHLESPQGLPPLPPYRSHQGGGRHAPSPVGFPQSLTLLSQGPRQSMGGQEFYFNNQADDHRVLGNPYSHHPVSATAPAYDVNFADAQNAIPGSHFSRLPEVTTSRTNSFESDVHVQIVRPHDWAPESQCGPWMDGYVGT